MISNFISTGTEITSSINGEQFWGLPDPDERSLALPGSIRPFWRYLTDEVNEPI